MSIIPSLPLLGPSDTLFSSFLFFPSFPLVSHPISFSVLSFTFSLFPSFSFFCFFLLFFARVFGTYLPYLHPIPRKN